MDIDSRIQTTSAIKFLLHVLMASGAITLIFWSMWIAGNLLLGRFDANTLQNAGILLMSIVALCITSGAAFHLASNAKNFAITVSTYNFYRTLLGSNHSLRLFITSYAAVEETFEVPLKARHISRQGKEIVAQWNAVNDWKVWDVKESNGWTGNARWIQRPSSVVTRELSFKKNTATKKV